MNSNKKKFVTDSIVKRKAKINNSIKTMETDLYDIKTSSITPIKLSKKKGVFPENLKSKKITENIFLNLKKDEISVNGINISIDKTLNINKSTANNKSRLSNLNYKNEMNLFKESIIDFSVFSKYLNVELGKSRNLNESTKEFILHLDKYELKSNFSKINIKDDKQLNMGDSFEKTARSIFKNTFIITNDKDKLMPSPIKSNNYELLNKSKANSDIAFLINLNKSLETEEINFNENSEFLSFNYLDDKILNEKKNEKERIFIYAFKVKKNDLNSFR